MAFTFLFSICPEVNYALLFVVAVISICVGSFIHVTTFSQHLLSSRCNFPKINKIQEAVNSEFSVEV